MAAIGGLIEISPGLRACAILDPEGVVLAQSEEADWAAEAARIWDAAADDARPEPVQVHVATEAGELYALRNGSGSAIAVTDRFTLASLMLCDLRAALRRLDRGTK